MRDRARQTPSPPHRSDRLPQTARCPRPVVATLLALAVAGGLNGCGQARPGDPEPLAAPPPELARRAELWQAVATDGRHAATLHPLAASYWRSGDLDSCRVLLEEAVALDPQHLDSLTWLSRLYYETGDIAAGLALLEPLAYTPRFEPPEILTNLAVLRMAAGRTDDASALLEQCVAVHPEYPAAYGNLGFIHMQAGDLEAARTALEAAIGRDPAVPQFHNNLGIVYRRMQRFRDAERAFQAAIAVAPDFIEAHHNLALLYKLYLHDDERARAAFRRFIALGGSASRQVTALFRLDESRR